MTSHILRLPVNFAMQSVKPSPLHVAIIMDGNGRWATRRGLPRPAGHRAGVVALRRVVEAAPELGIGTLTVYAFSADNWRRPVREVDSIFWLLRAFLRLETKRLCQRGVRVQAIGRRDRLPAHALRALEDAEAATAAGSKLTLRVAIDYSSREALVRAAAAHVAPDRIGAQDESTGAQFRQAFEDCGPQVDLLIRTGGEQRLSDFLLWESAYAELYFTPALWPDFDGEDLRQAMAEFHRRERRFGALPEAPIHCAGAAR